MRVNLRFYSCFLGYKKDSEPVRADIIEYAEGRLKPERHIDERNLTSVAVLEKIHGGKIIEWKNTIDENSKSDYCIDLGESIKKRFCERCFHDGFRSTSAVVRGLIYPRIMNWKKKYDSEVKTDTPQIKEESLKSSYVTESEKKLTKGLENLVQYFDLGKGLIMNWQPQAENSNEGEVKDNTIKIHSLTYEEAKKTVPHEFIEKTMNELTSQFFVDAINSNRILNELFWKEVIKEYNKGKIRKNREDFIEKIVGLIMKSGLLPD